MGVNARKGMVTMRRRIIALGLSLALVLGLLPMAAMASDTGEDPTYWRQQHNYVMETKLANAPEWSTVRFGAGPTSYADASPRAPENEVIRPGVDVSSWQGDIDWEAVAEAGIEFAIIRVAWRGYGTAEGEGKLHWDPYYISNIKEAKANGIKVGAYIFSQAITVEEAVEEADYLMYCLEEEGLTVDLPLVLDYEYSGDNGRLEMADLSRQEHTNICNAFCAQVEKHGYESMVYANRYMLEKDLYPDALGRIWLANYGVATGYKGDYEYWQFSSRGSVYGIKGDVDLNFWFDPDNKTPSGLPFRDVRVGVWYYSDVKWAYKQGIVNGVSSTSFSPESQATRGEIVTMLYRMEGSPRVSGSTNFTDLTQDYYKDAVRWAEQNKIVNGVSSTRFAPGEKIQRQQFVTMLYRMAGSPSTSQSLSGYSDADKVASYAKNAMAWAVEEGLVTGYGNGALGPENYASRAEICALLMRYQNL